MQLATTSGEAIATRHGLLYLFWWELWGGLVRADAIWHDLRRMQRLIHDLGQRLVPAEVLIVELGVASWVNPTEIRHSVELSDSLVDQVAEAQRCAVFERI